MKARNIFDYLRSWLRGPDSKNRIEEHLTDYEIEKLRVRLNSYMRDQKPYLKQQYRIKDMASDLGVPAYQLSSFINKVIGMHFSDFVNKSRVEYCQRMMRTKNARQQSMKELAFKCGFNNRNTFTTAFKKFAGVKPSEYARTA